MQAFVDAVKYIRSLRRGDRSERFKRQMTVLIDSDILIEVSRGRNKAVIATWMELSTSDAEVRYSPAKALPSD